VMEKFKKKLEESNDMRRRIKVRAEKTVQSISSLLLCIVFGRAKLLLGGC
jgi:hypothetical protein